ncbi:MAG: YaiI/YqxD family protein [Planctomycetota bacterium]
MTIIYIDADACPVKDETYRVASRYALLVYVVANSWMRMPDDPQIRLEVVGDGFDAADDWIAERAGAGDVVVTDDIPLAARCIAAGALVITTRGERRDTNSIGDAMAMRELMQYMRAAGEVGGGPKALDERDRRHFRQELDKVVTAALRAG